MEKDMSILRCWCGNSDLQPFSEDYLLCLSCNSLVLRNQPNEQFLSVEHDEIDFYGKKYWFKHQEEELGLHNIVQRSRSDLTQRCLYWLEALLKYKLPPGRLLELGSAHGGFVALMKWAGFEASGLEMSPWVVDYARETFGVSMLVGPVEQQEIPPGSLDGIVLMDVLEHLSDPLASISYSIKLLKPDGILFIQTPCYPVGVSYNEMIMSNHPFLSMCKPPEHIHLLSNKAMAILLDRLGMNYQAFEPAIFSQYDMSVIASREPLQVNSKEEVEEYLTSQPSTRIIMALLDLYRSLRSAEEKFMECEKDRNSRLENIEVLSALLEDAQEDRAARLASIQQLELLLKESEADRAARLNSMNQLESWLKESEARRLELDAKVVESEAHCAELSSRITESEARRAQVEAKIAEYYQNTSILIENTQLLSKSMQALTEKTDQLLIELNRPSYWRLARYAKIIWSKLRRV